MQDMAGWYVLIAQIAPAQPWKEAVMCILHIPACVSCLVPRDHADRGSWVLLLKTDNVEENSHYPAASPVIQLGAATQWTIRRALQWMWPPHLQHCYSRTLPEEAAAPRPVSLLPRLLQPFAPQTWALNWTNLMPAHAHAIGNHILMAVRTIFRSRRGKCGKGQRYP